MDTNLGFLPQYHKVIINESLTRPSTGPGSQCDSSSGVSWGHHTLDYTAFGQICSQASHPTLSCLHSACEEKVLKFLAELEQRPGTSGSSESLMF